jgi:hypothetical protein
MSAILNGAIFRITDAQRGGRTVVLNFDKIWGTRASFVYCTIWRTSTSFKFTRQYGGRALGLNLPHNMADAR